MGISSQLAAARLIQPGVCTSSTRPASPFEGQVIYETDTDRTLTYDGTAWTVVSKLTGGGSNFRFGYETRTTTYTPGASIATASDVFTNDITWTADGTSTYWIEFYCPYVYTQNAADAAVIANLVDGSGNDLGAIATLGPAVGTAQREYAMIFAKVPYSPASGSRSINIRARYSNGSDAGMVAGTGGSGQQMPMWVAVYGPALT